MALDLTSSFLEVGTRGIPVVTATVAKASGNVIYLTAPPSATPDMFFGGQVEVMSGALAGMRTAIVESAGSTITVAGAFTGKLKLALNDTVQLSGGPLAEAACFMFEPDTVLASSQNGTKFTVTTNIISSKLSLATIGKKLKAWLSFSKIYDFEVVLEAPNITGDGSDPGSLRKAMFDLKVLKEQCEILIVDYRAQESNRIYGDSDIDGTYGMIQRTGSDCMKRAATLEFSVRQS